MGKQQEELLMEVEVNDEAIHESMGEAVVDEERCEAEEIQKATIEYAQKCLTQVEINEIKKNSPDLGTRLREGFKKKKKKLTFKKFKLNLIKTRGELPRSKLNFLCCSDLSPLTWG